MKYQKIVQGTFKERPNRFIAFCEIAGETHKVHVKNTGRCKELLIPGTTVYLEESDNPTRQTRYSLIAVQKGDLLINMDSQAPNVVVEEALISGRMKLPGLSGPLTHLKREVTYGESRFDFYGETEQEKFFLEVKGVTLEERGVVRFPDAPTERGIKHLNELIKATEEDYCAYVVFVVQMESALYFTPHRERHLEFAQALEKAHEHGVRIIAHCCKVTPDHLELTTPLTVRFDDSF